MRSIRKQAGPVSEATPGTVLNTLVNPAAYFYGDYWVPEFMLGKSTPNGRETITSPFPTKDPNVNAFMFHTAAIGTTAAAIAAAAVLMRRLSYGEKERRKREEMVSNRAQVDAPVFAAGATPEKEQHKLDEAGIDKQASSAMVPPLSVILPIAALAVGGTLGHRGMSVYLDKQHEAELDDDLDKTRAELEQQQYEALMKARGAKQVGVIPKQGAATNVPGVFVAGVDGELAIVDPATGARRWSARVQSPLEQPPLVDGRFFLAAAARGVVVAFR